MPHFDEVDEASPCLYDIEGYHVLYVQVDKVVILEDNHEYIGVSYKSRYMEGRYKNDNYILSEIEEELQKNNYPIIRIQDKPGILLGAEGFSILADYYK